ncbi:MAG: prolipoprotein diacylglyceryl transferase [Halanaerobiales bacterium]|nr:prolipoprotein diacylglyceryl transferase [Halanaerobiales bacterium]
MFTVHWYGIIIALAIILGFSLVMYLSKKTNISSEFFLDFFIIGIPIGIIGARVYFVLFNFSYYLNNPLQIIAIWKGGLAIHGAIIGGLIVLIVLTKRRKISLWTVTDLLAPALILGQAIGRWGNFINQEAYGSIVSEEFINYFPEFIKNQMYIEGAYRHPTFLYESVWNLLIFILLIWLINKEFKKDGDVFFTYLIGYSIGRFFIEDLRTDSLMFLNIQVAQLISGLLIIFAIVMLYFRHKPNR